MTKWYNQWYWDKYQGNYAVPSELVSSIFPNFTTTIDLLTIIRGSPLTLYNRRS